MPLSGLDRLLWAAGLLGHVVLLAVLFSRKRAARFPAFTALIGCNVVRTLLLFEFFRRYGTGDRYLVAYLVTETVDVLLQLAVVYEVASHVFRPLGRWAPDTRRNLPALIWGSLAVALLLTWMTAPTGFRWVVALVVRGTFFSSLLMSELCVGFIVLSVTVGLPWKTHVARIAHGLGAYSIIDVVLGAGRTLFRSGEGAEVHHALTMARKIVYLLCLVYWIVTLWQEAPQPRAVPPEMLEELRALQARVAYDLYTLRNWRKP